MTEVLYTRVDVIWHTTGSNLAEASNTKDILRSLGVHYAGGIFLSTLTGYLNAVRAGFEHPSLFECHIW